MKILLDDNELDEIKIEDIVKSADNGVVKFVAGRGEKKNVDDLQKEITAHDAIESGQENAGKINGVSQEAASRYERGQHLSEDARSRVLNHKHQIADIAITKLMDSLNLFDPSQIEKQRDLVDAASKMAGIVDKIQGQNGKNTGNQVVLNLYGPRQKELRDYEVVEVN